MRNSAIQMQREPHKQVITGELTLPYRISFIEITETEERMGRLGAGHTG